MRRNGERPEKGKRQELSEGDAGKRAPILIIIIILLLILLENA